MNAKIVLEIAKILSTKEQAKLLRMLREELHIKKYPKRKLRPLITREEADAYIYYHVFCKNKNEEK